jgi:hypothetical protein
MQWLPFSERPYAHVYPPASSGGGAGDLPPTTTDAHEHGGGGASAAGGGDGAAALDSVDITQLHIRGVLFVSVLKCTDLPNSFTGGKADACVAVSCGNSRQVTATHKNQAS